MYKEFELKTFSDNRGKLTPIELLDLGIFEVKRVYAVYHNLGSRGGHAHFKEEELFFMAEGSAIARLHDGTKWIAVKLEVGKNALYVGKLIWHEFDNFSEGASLVALSSTSYNPSREDYVEDFNKFLTYV